MSEKSMGQTLLPSPSEAEIIEVVADVIGISESAIDQESSMSNTPKWDSLAHVHLIMAIESKWNLMIRPEQAVELVSISNIIKFIRDGCYDTDRQ